MRNDLEESEQGINVVLISLSVALAILLVGNLMSVFVSDANISTWIIFAFTAISILTIVVGATIAFGIRPTMIGLSSVIVLACISAELGMWP